MVTETTQTNGVTQPMNLVAALNLLQTTDECLRYFDSTTNTDFYVTRDVVSRVVRKNGKRVKETVVSWSGSNKYGEQHTFNIADFENVNWYLMDFDENGNPVWESPNIRKDTSEVTGD